MLYTGLLEAAEKFTWAANAKEIVTTAFLSMVPFFEGRYALLVANGLGMPRLQAYLMAFICSSIPVPFILLLLRIILDWMYSWNIAWIRKFLEWLGNRFEKKSKTVQRIGLLGLYLFVAVPLPGTGVWTGSGIASLLKMKRLQAGIVILLGNATACLITTLCYQLGVQLF